MASVLGLMTGTSLDGLDLAWVESDPFSLVDGTLIPFPDDLRHRLSRLANAPSIDLRSLGQTETAYSEWLAVAVHETARARGWDLGKLDAVACHGQTLAHQPEGAEPFTFQLLNPGLLAERLNCAVIADFRRRDVAAGGQGAPLVPPFHAAMFGHLADRVAVVNIGGIANITLCGRERDTVTGFDTGPGNGLLDAWCADRLGCSYDRDGALSARGRVLEDVLEQWLADPYFALPPPKSTGREMFSLEWLQARLPASEAEPQDVLRTLVELTARTIAGYLSECEQVVVCGGGVHNQTLMGRLKALSPAPVGMSDDFGIPADLLEATAFAWLGIQALAGVPTARASVTGASRDTVSAGVWGLEYLLGKASDRE